MPSHSQCLSAGITAHPDDEKRNHFSSMNKSVNTQCNSTKFILLLLMNIIIDVTYLISGINTNFQRLLCIECDVGHYVISNGVMKLMIAG